MKLSIKNISKTYDNNVQALKNVNLEIGNGMFGLLGPNVHFLESSNVYLI